MVDTILRCDQNSLINLNELNDDILSNADCITKKKSV